MFSDSEVYQKSLQIFSQNIDWQQLKNKTIIIIGASGLIGTYLVDLLMYQNKVNFLNINIVAVGRNESNLKRRFCQYLDNINFKYFIEDINTGFNYTKRADYLLHLASNTHPIAYAQKPIETLMTNINGSYNLMSWAKEKLNDRFLFLSSVEIYGQAQNGQKFFKETDCGFIDCNTVRACYNEGKRAGEALCQAFIKEHNLDIVIARLCRVYGATVKNDDSKAITQFINNGINKENIVLKSNGEQLFSYLYVGDVVNAILFLLLHGKIGEAYNVADKESDIKLKDLAQIIANIAQTKVVYELPDEVEAEGYSKAEMAILESQKINKLGWKVQYSIKHGIEETINILR